MQAITIAIGKTGINFFAQHYLIPQLIQLLGKLAPADRNISVPDFNSQDGDVTYYVSNLSIALSNGSLAGFSPAFQTMVQGTVAGVPAFTFTFQAPHFSANYSWYEAYHLVTDTFTPPNSMSSIPSDPRNTYAYAPGFGGMAITLVIQFAFDKSNNAWQMTAGPGSATAQQPAANIPSDSILQTQDIKCFVGHVDQTTEASITATNFTNLINGLISGVITSIQGSGNLGNNILYDFSPGDSGLAFPNNDGIQMGIKGGASYNGTAFSGDTPPSLPIPAPLADDDPHHLNMYVSNYEIDALNWAFFKAGKLTTTVNADDLANPDVLKVKTYYPSCPQLKPYTGRAMQAQIQPNTAPVTSFQMVYELSETVMGVLKTQLPTAVYNNVSGLQGNNYTSKADLESDLNGNGVPSTYYAIIETAAESMGMVVSHDINYTIVIQDFQPVQPTIVFNVKRTDVLSGLVLGLGGADQKTQTLQFQFTNVTWTETFISSSIPKLDASVFNNLWQGAGETQYADLLIKMGQNGTPLPIMQGFQFDFTSAVLSIQENYISILAKVQFNAATAAPFNA